MKVFLQLICLLIFGIPPIALFSQVTIFKDVRLIDGRGGQPILHTDVKVESNIITAIGRDLSAKDATIVNLRGKTMMPAISTMHCHIGTLQGTSNKSEHYTRENIIHQLIKYADYGVLNLQVMGSDRPLLFNTGLRDSSVNGLIPGARIYSAGNGFGVPGNAPPAAVAMDLVFRPSSKDAVPAELDSLLALKPSLVKIWVDDFQGKFIKMSFDMYTTIITESHKRGLRVAAHLYYLEDAKQLVRAGLDIIAHSIRDKQVDEEMLDLMKAHHVIYIPTLSLDDYAYIYSRKPEWINDPFFKASLEPGVYEMITAKSYQDSIKNSPLFAQNMMAFSTALKNVKLVADAGILVALGTDSGATPVRTQGFSEHLEMELLVQAGLRPLQVITIATKNPCTALKIEAQYGTLENGKSADFIIVTGDVLKNIKNTRKIQAVYKAGKKISNGPLA